MFLPSCLHEMRSQTQTLCLPRFVNKYFEGFFSDVSFAGCHQVLILKLIMHLNNENEFKFKERCYFHYFTFSLRTRFLNPWNTSRISLLKGKVGVPSFRALYQKEPLEIINAKGTPVRIHTKTKTKHLASKLKNLEISLILTVGNSNISVSSVLTMLSPASSRDSSA